MLRFSSNEETVLSAITTLIYLKENETKAGDNSDRNNHGGVLRSDSGIPSHWSCYTNRFLYFDYTLRCVPAVV